MGKIVAGRMVYESNSVLSERLSDVIAENTILAENYSALARATLEFDEVGWRNINGLTENHIKLSDVQAIASNARLQTNSNALLKRGSMLRASYVFGRGFKMSSNGQPLPPRYQKIVDDPRNQQVLFSESACKKNERTLFTDGNFFAVYDTKTSRFSRMPLGEITSYALDPDDHEVVLYMKRSYSRTSTVDQNGTTTQLGQDVEVWYPTDMADPSATTATIDKVKVDRTKVIFHRKENDETGSIWGIPDCLPALPWAWSYSEYLKDGSKMLKALSSIAWQIKSKSSKGVANASSRVASNRQVAATVSTGSDVEMSAMPRSNAIDLDTGRPLAAMAATAMEVSTDALLSGAGATSGAGIQVLDQSTLNAAYGRQGNWEDYFTRILTFIGVRDAQVDFNKIIVDPAYRNVQSVGQAWQSGLFDPSVIQAAYAEELGIEAPGAVPAGVLVPNHEVPTNVATSQGNSGAGVGDITNGDNILRDNTNTPQ